MTAVFEAAAAALLSAVLAGPPGASDRAAWLRSEGRLSEAESRTLERGGMVAKVIETEDRSAVYTFAAAQVRATPTRVVELLRNLEGRGREPWTLESGRVGEPATPADFARLTLDAREVKALSRCRVNDCDVRLPADAIVRMRSELDGTASDVRAARANALFAELLAGYAAAYQARGNPALFEYANNDDPVRIADSLDRLLRGSSLLYGLAPDVFALQRDYPEGRPKDAEQYCYWTKERFWLSDVVSLSQTTIVDRAAGTGRLVVAVSKQLYASHYYESSLGLTVFVAGPAGEGWVFVVNRVRADIRRSGFTRVERLVLNHLVRHRLDARMSYLKTELERDRG